jgi:peptidoglycan/xylan/chitin deacetylase (PgdA/CDA1 family)
MKKFFDEDKLFKNVYLSKTDIKELKKYGNIIGSHTITHKVLSRLSYNKQYKEIANSFEYLNNIIDLNYKSFCYPYGYKSSYNENTLKILKELNINDSCIFDNKIQDSNIKQFELSRIDCNNFMEI